MIEIKKRAAVLIVVALAGLVMVKVSYDKMSLRLNEPVETRKIVVANGEIAMYDVIELNDLHMADIPKETDTDGYITDMADVLGKVAKFNMGKGNWFHEDSILSATEMKSIAFVTINTSYAKTGGASAGDRVDVYRVDTDDTWVEGRGSVLVASDVEVVRITDRDGRGIGRSSGVSALAGSTGGKTEVVRLGVKPEQVKYLVPASSEVENSYVLVVRSINTEDYKGGNLVNESTEEIEEEQAEGDHGTEEELGEQE